MNNAVPQADVPKPTRRGYQFSLRSLLMLVTLCAILCSALLTFWTYVVYPAREAARRLTCENKLHDYSHACWGDVVWLSQDNKVARVSSCPICRQMDHPLWDQPIRFLDSKGLPVDESAVPPKTVEEAKRRVGENGQKVKAQFRDAAANNPHPQSESPPGSSDRGEPGK